MNQDQEQLERAVLDAPEDDSPRLVYADWVQEHGDDEFAAALRRAEANWWTQRYVADRSRSKAKVMVPYRDCVVSHAALRTPSSEWYCDVLLPTIHAYFTFDARAYREGLDRAMALLGVNARPIDATEQRKGIDIGQLRQSMFRRAVR